MTKPTPEMLSWLQRALRHEFAAARQFTLQVVVANELGDSALASECEQSATEELKHAQRFATALLKAGAGFGGGMITSLPIGNNLTELIEYARSTEAEAVRLYRDAARACRGAETLCQLFESIGADEEAHYEHLTKRLREATPHVR